MKTMRELFATYKKTRHDCHRLSGLPLYPEANRQRWQTLEAIDQRGGVLTERMAGDLAYCRKIFKGDADGR